jgi:hypothetical protein
MNQIENQIESITPVTPMTPMTPMAATTIKNRKKIKKSKKSKKNATRRKNRGMVGGITPEKFAKDEATSMELSNNLIALPDGTTVMRNKVTTEYMGNDTGDVQYTITYKGNKVPKILIEKKDGKMKKKIGGKVLDLSPNDPEDAKDVAKLDEYKKKAEENIAKRKEELARAAKVEVEVAAPVANVTRYLPSENGILTGDIDYTIVDEQGKKNMLRRKLDGSMKTIIIKNYVSQESDMSPDAADIQKVNEFEAEHPVGVESPAFRAKFPLVANLEAAAKNTDDVTPVNPPIPAAEAGNEVAAAPPPPANPEVVENVDVIAPAPAPVNSPVPAAEAGTAPPPPANPEVVENVDVIAPAPVNPPVQEAEISGEASAPPQEAEISGEASAPPQEVETGNEASAPPQETEAGNEASAPPQEVETGNEASAPPQETEAGNEASAPPQETEAGNEASAPPQETEAEISSEMDAAGKALREEAKRLQEKLDALKSQLNMIPESSVEPAVVATPETASGGGGLNKMMKKWKKTFHKKYNSRTSMKRKNKTNRNKYNMDLNHFVL